MRHGQVATLNKKRVSIFYLWNLMVKVDMEGKGVSSFKK